MENLTPIKTIRTFDTLNEFFGNLGKPDESNKTVISFGKRRSPLSVDKHRLIRSRQIGEECKHCQKIQNQPFKAYLNAILPPVIRPEREKVKFKPLLRKNVPEIGVEEWESPIPMKTLIRRPRTKRCNPLTESDEYFQYLVSFPHLKQVTFDDNPAKNLVFYMKNYPLILKNVDVEQTTTIMINKRRVRSPQLLLQRHREAMSLKQKQLDRRIKQLEKESGEFFVAALRNKVFDPQSWPWNKEDQMDKMLNI